MGMDLCPSPFHVISQSLSFKREPVAAVPIMQLTQCHQQRQYLRQVPPAPVDSLLTASDLDAVVIATPHHLLARAVSVAIPLVLIVGMSAVLMAVLLGALR
jgi:hypothetical protein